LLNAKVAIHLLEKLGVVHITHAKDGFEGNFTLVVELISSIGRLQERKV
jgi:hypothetical protein